MCSSRSACNLSIPVMAILLCSASAHETQEEDSLDDSLAPANTHQKSDPHEPPRFDSKSLTQPTSTVLYLPPLLSSLPPGVEVHSLSTDSPPLVTETHLPDIDPVSLSLHKALHHFRPLSNGYATSPYAEAFNWLELDLLLDEEREWYAVVFRSKRKPGSDSSCSYHFEAPLIIISIGFEFSPIRGRQKGSRGSCLERWGACSLE